MTEEKAVKTVTLFAARYNELVEAELTLRALEAGGVDNWEGYDEALSNRVKIEDGPRVVWR